MIARGVTWALEDALIRRFGALPRGDADVAMRTDNALVYASKLHRELAKSYDLHQEIILSHTPGQNGVAESFMGTLNSSAWGNIDSRPTTERRPRSPRG